MNTYSKMGVKRRDTALTELLQRSKSTRASQLSDFADKVYEASEPVHVAGELDYMDDQPQAGGPDTWTDAERNL